MDQRFSIGRLLAGTGSFLELRRLVDPSLEDAAGVFE